MFLPLLVTEREEAEALDATCSEAIYLGPVPGSEEHRVLPYTWSDLGHNFVFDKDIVVASRVKTFEKIFPEQQDHRDPAPARRRADHSQRCNDYNVEAKER